MPDRREIFIIRPRKTPHAKKPMFFCSDEWVGSKQFLAAALCRFTSSRVAEDTWRVPQLLVLGSQPFQ